MDLKPKLVQLVKTECLEYERKIDENSINNKHSTYAFACFSNLSMIDCFKNLKEKYIY